MSTRADELTILGRIMPASNATFLAELRGRRVVYKPVAGERPLWDFPTGTLAQREVAAYAVSEELGWGVVPRTWLAEGPHGPGMVQEWQEPDTDVLAVDVVPTGEEPPGWLHVVEAVDGEDRPVTLVHEDTTELRRMAVLDVVINNGDRKGGHVLAMADGRRYGVDHGVCFSVDPKLRTVLWGWTGSPLTPEERAGVERVLSGLEGELGRRLVDLLTAEEVAGTAARCRGLLAAGQLPGPSPHWPSIPWPAF